MKISYSAEELAEIVKPQSVRGSTSYGISGIASLAEAGAGELSFLGNKKYRSTVKDSAASVVLVPLDFDESPAEDQCYFLVENPSAALATVCARIEQSLWPRPAPGVHPTAVIGEGCQIASSATIGPLCVVESGARIGEGTHLQAQVFVGREAEVGQACWLAAGAHVASYCRLGDRVRMHGGAVVGSDGFGYEVVEGRHAKVPQVGLVEIQNDVEIGANSTLDRARFSRTVIGEGTKIDNLVQVAHNVVTGKHCILCAQVGIAGSTTLADYVVLGGQVGVTGHVTIAQGVQVGGGGGVTSSLPDPGVYSGNPAMPYHLERRIIVLQRRLPELFKKVNSMLNELEELKKASA